MIYWNRRFVVAAAVSKFLRKKGVLNQLRKEEHYNLIFSSLKRKEIKNSFEKKYGVLATAISLPLCIYLYVNIVRFILRSQDLRVVFGSSGRYVGDIFPRGQDAPGINDSFLENMLC